MKQIAIYCFLVAIGCLQAVADVLGWEKVKALALASQVSPAPRVFTSQNGFETFSSQFFIDVNTEDDSRSLRLTPEVYQGIEGPYNRRNAYGAAFSYGPVLNSRTTTRPMFKSALQFAVCHSEIFDEIGVDMVSSEDRVVNVRVVPREPLSIERGFKTEFLVECQA